MKNIYVASPLGFSESYRGFYEDRLLPLVRGCGLGVLDPWSLPPEVPAPGSPKRLWEEFNMAKGRANADAIASSDGVLAVLDGTDVDSGTASEIGYAFALGKKIVGYRGDFRLTGDNPASVVNLQVEYFIMESGGRVVLSAAEIPGALREIFGD